MPRVDKRIRVQQHLSRAEELLVLLMLDLVNPLREQASLPPVTPAQAYHRLDELAREQRPHLLAAKDA